MDTTNRLEGPDCRGGVLQRSPAGEQKSQAVLEGVRGGLLVPATDAAWAFDDVFHAWWVEPGKILAGEYPGSPQSEHHEFKLMALVDVGIRTIIDLTRDVDGLAPYGRS